MAVPAFTPGLEAERQNLGSLIESDAVCPGDLTPSTGKQATGYADTRKLTLDHRPAPAIGRIMSDLIIDVGGAVRRVVGRVVGRGPATATATPGRPIAS